MSDLSIITRNRYEQVYDRLRDMIDGLQAQPGQRLQSMRVLAGRFGTSVPTVQRAIVQLEDEGLLQRRHGSGTFIAGREAETRTVDRAVTLGIEVGADVFGELADQLVQRLQGRDFLVNLMNINVAPGVDGRAGGNLPAQLAKRADNILVLHGNIHLFSHLTPDILRRYRTVGIVDWDNTSIAPTTAVLSDHLRGVELVEEHLWELGHRRLLIVGTSIQIWHARQELQAQSPLSGSSVRQWTARGGSSSTLGSRATTSGESELDAAEFLARFDSDQPPTAIFGLRDVEANQAQRLLRRYRPELCARTAIIGYYDTPWAQCADPPISTVNLDIASIARLAVDRIVALHAGEPTAAEPTRVPPRLVVRGSSLPGPYAAAGT